MNDTAWQWIGALLMVATGGYLIWDAHRQRTRADRAEAKVHAATHTIHVWAATYASMDDWQKWLVGEQTVTVTFEQLSLDLGILGPEPLVD